MNKLTKKELKEFIKKEQILNDYQSRKKDLIELLYYSDRYLIRKFLKNLRYAEYYRKLSFEYSGFLKIYYKFRWLLFRRRKNIIGKKLNIEIYEDSLGWNIIIYHGNIIIHPYAKLGENCRLHGMNCIGNDGKSNNNIPSIGNNVDISIGAKIIGNVKIGDYVLVGAGSVVNKSFDESCVIAGVPAKKIR